MAAPRVVKIDGVNLTSQYVEEGGPEPRIEGIVHSGNPREDAEPGMVAANMTVTNKPNGDNPSGYNLPPFANGRDLRPGR